MRSGRRVRLGLAALALSAACASPTGSAAPVLARHPALLYDYRSPSGAVVSSPGFLGRPSVLAFVTTYDFQSQMALRLLRSTLRTFTPRANAAAVVMEPASFAPLVDVFAQSLELEFPAVMADEPTLSGAGPFGTFDQLPTLVFLDRDGREVGRLQGPQISAETLREALRRTAEAGRTRE